MNATVEVMYAATGLEWNGRTGQGRTGVEWRQSDKYAVSDD